MHDFIVNRYFYGDFSSATPGVGTNTFEELSHPLGHLYLAGEGYIFGLHSSVHGALVHGSKVAERIVWEILGPLTGKHWWTYESTIRGGELSNNSRKKLSIMCKLYNDASK